jgi:predicted transcriptional regulator
MASTVIASNVADDRLIAAMRENSYASVCELTELLGLSCPAVSRRIARLKALGVVDYVDDAGWSSSRSRRSMRHGSDHSLLRPRQRAGGARG